MCIPGGQVPKDHMVIKEMFVQVDRDARVTIAIFTGLSACTTIGFQLVELLCRNKK